MTDNINEEDEYLCFIKLIGQNSNGYEYEFYFTENIEEVWGEGFDVMPCFLIPDLIPYEKCYNLIKTVTLNKDINLDIATSDSCHTFQDCIDNVVALASQSLTNLTEYPKEGRLIFYFGEKFDSVENKLSERKTFFPS